MVADRNAGRARALSHGEFTDHWFGGVDDLELYQGAMADIWVRDLYDRQAIRLPAT